MTDQPRDETKFMVEFTARELLDRLNAFSQELDDTREEVRQTREEIRKYNGLRADMTDLTVRVKTLEEQHLIDQSRKQGSWDVLAFVRNYGPTVLLLLAMLLFWVANIQGWIAI